jgi:cation diffusion facilitator family transporter
MVHEHDFVPASSVAAERGTRVVVALSAATMVVELVAGTYFNSMALVADGWHMASHTGALAIAAFAYVFARRHRTNPRYSWGTGKVAALGGFANAVALALVAILMVFASVARLLEPESIAFDQALVVATVGFAVNLSSAWVLMRADESGTLHGHQHHDHDHHDHHHRHDHNLRAAYLHVLADALTSVLAIAALLTGKFLGWDFMDAAMGVVGGVVILRWSVGLLRQTADQLLDHTAPMAPRIEARLNELGDTLLDLHVWRVSGEHVAAVISVETKSDRSPADYHRLLRATTKLDHLTMEVHVPGDG